MIFHWEAILDANKLNGPNFLDWYLNLRIVLKQEKILAVLDEPLINESKKDTGNEAWDAYRTYVDHATPASCIMISSTTLELQEQHDKMDQCSDHDLTILKNMLRL